MSKTLNSFRATMELRGIRHQAAQYLLAELGSVLLFFFFFHFFTIITDPEHSPLDCCVFTLMSKEEEK